MHILQLGGNAVKLQNFGKFIITLSESVLCFVVSICVAL